MVDPIRTAGRTTHTDHDADGVIGNTPGTRSAATPARTSGSGSSSPAAPRDSFDGGGASVGRCLIRRGVFANSPPQVSCRAPLMDLITQLHSQPLPPTALERLPSAPPGIEQVREQRNEASFREGAIATASALLGPALGHALGGQSLGHDGVVLGESVAAVVGTTHEAIRGDNVVVAATRNMGDYALSHMAGAVFDSGSRFGPGGVAVAGMRLTGESLIGGLESADAVADASHAVGTWGRARDAAGRTAQEGRVDGRNAALAADLTSPGLPRSIDAARMQTDGDYARAVIATLEERLQSGQF